MEEKTSYRRDLPDGSSHYFLGHLERPSAEQLYFDDILVTRESDRLQPLKVLYFGKEQSYPNRVLNRFVNQYILHYITDGKGTFNGRTVTKGEGFLVVPGADHCMASDGEDPWHFRWISFEGREAKWQMKHIGLDEENPYFRFDFGDQLEELFDDVIYQEHGDCELNTYMQGVFYIIMSYHQKQYSRDRSRENIPAHYVRKALQYVDEYYREPMRMEDIAAKLHISRKYLCSVFQQRIGMTPKEYLLLRRLDAAADLLVHTDMTVSEIAAHVGYGDYTQLSRLFRMKRGISPKDYRKQMREERQRDRQEE